MFLIGLLSLPLFSLTAAAAAKQGTMDSRDV